MRSIFGLLLPFIFFIAIIFTLGNVIYSYNIISSLQRSDELYDRSLMVKAELDRLYTALLRAETNQRSYILTGNNVFLTNFSSAIPDITKQMQSLRQVISTASQKQSFIGLEQNAEERISLLREGVALRDAEGFEAAQAFVAEGRGTIKMQEIQQIINAMQIEENKTLSNRQTQAARNYQAIYTSTMIANAASFGLTVGTFYLIYKELRKRNEEERNKDEFINMASHELKTPVTSLKIFTHVLNKKLINGQVAEAKRYISKIDGQTTKLTLLISDLLDISRIQTGKMRFEKENFNLDALIDETVEEVQGTTKKHTLITKGSVNRLVSADRYRIYQVLVNLLTNAVKYSPDGGEIMVRSKVAENKAIVSVQDSGIGIDPKYQKKIFERLYQVTDSKEKTYPGLGVGLYISAHIMDMHKGNIWVESEKGKGSTFFISLPLEHNTV